MATTIWTTTLTIGSFTFGETFYGYNEDAGAGSLSDNTSDVYDGAVVEVIQWAGGSFDKLQVRFQGNSRTNGRWGYLQIGSSQKFYREDANIDRTSDPTATIFEWTQTTNPIGTSGNVTVGFYYEEPDTNVSVNVFDENGNDTNTISRNATSFDVLITGITDQPDYYFGYAVTDAGSSDTTEFYETVLINPTQNTLSAPTWTGSGATFPPQGISQFTQGTSVRLTVTDLPAAGSSKTYYVYAARTGLSGGAGGSNNEGPGAWKYINRSFSVTRSTNNSQPSDEPPIPDYGLAIYDDSGSIVTGFTGDHTVFREVFNGSVTVSTSSTTDIATGLTGLSTSNSIIATSAQGTDFPFTGFQTSVPTRFNNGTDVRIGRAGTAGTVKVQVLQYKDATLGSNSSYGLEIRNENNSLVIDENAFVYGVKEVLNVGSLGLTWTLFGNIEFAIYNLSGVYGGSGGSPIPALASSEEVWLVPPTLLGSPGNYSVLLIKESTANRNNMKLAILVASTEVTPDSYDSSSYGLQIFDSSNNLAWDSGWKQAVVNNIQDVNIFSAGVSQNSAYDVTTGADGVFPPSAPVSESIAPLRTQEETVSFSGKSQMDPVNTYVIGTCCAGHVQYYEGAWQPQGTFSSNQGGGRHVLAGRITGTNSYSLKMFRYADGPPPPSGQEGTRVAGSYHPQGHMIFARII